jgi:hypothetical protein
MIANNLKAGLICLYALGIFNNSVAQISGTAIKNIFTGIRRLGRRFRPVGCVYDILVKYGFNVCVVREAETFFKTLRPQRTYLPNKTTKNYGPRLVDETAALRPVSLRESIR